MSWVRGIVIIKHNVLLFLAALDHFRGTGLKLGLDLLDDWKNVRREDREDEDVHLILELFDQVWQYRDFLNSLIDCFDQSIMPLQYWKDLLLHIIQKPGPLLGFARGDIFIMLLSIVRLGLKPVHFICLVVLVAQQSIGNLAEQILQETLGGRAALRIRDNTFQSLYLRLSGLIRHLTKHRMKEVNPTKCTSNNRIDAFPRILDSQLGVTTNVREDFGFSQLDKA